MHEVPLSAATRWPGEHTVFVDCDAGSDAQDGLSATTALRTLPAAQLAARTALAAGAALSVSRAVAVEVLGSCHLEKPLRLTAADAGSSAKAPTICAPHG